MKSGIENSLLQSLSLMQRTIRQQYQFQQWFQPLQLAVRHMPRNGEQPAHTISEKEKKMTIGFKKNKNMYLKSDQIKVQLKNMR